MSSLASASTSPQIKLENELLKADKKTIDTQKVLFLLWKNRMDSKYICDLLQVFSKFIDEKRVYNEIEFYLPQLAHMVVHFDESISNACIQAFEELALSLAKISMHTAQQLSFILIAAIEDYQPENADGEKNSNFNFYRFLRCAKLLKRIEQMVVFRNVSPSPPIQNANNINNHSNNNTTSTTTSTTNNRNSNISSRSNITNKLDDSEFRKSGFLLYKRVDRKSRFATKPWKRRFFSVTYRVLNCYRNADDDEPLRSILLPGCVLEMNPVESKYNYAFSLYNKTTYIRFQMRAADEESYNSWINYIKNELEKPPYLNLPNATLIPSISNIMNPSSSTASSNNNTDSHANNNGVSTGGGGGNDNFTAVNSPSTLDSLTSEERNRFHFFHQQRLFVSNLTEISERLRFQERPLRKYFLRRDMKQLVVPPFCYLPLCTSLTAFRCVLRQLPNDCYAFNTKARCPALMLFEIEEHPDGADTACFLGKEIQDYSENEIQEFGSQEFFDYSVAETIPEGSITKAVNSNRGVNNYGYKANESTNNNSNNNDDVMPPLHLAMKESKFNRMIAAASRQTGDYWNDEGKGMKKLGGEGIMNINLPPPSNHLALIANANNASGKIKESINSNDDDAVDINDNDDDLVMNGNDGNQGTQTRQNRLKSIVTPSSSNLALATMNNTNNSNTTNTSTTNTSTGISTTSITGSNPMPSTITADTAANTVAYYTKTNTSPSSPPSSPKTTSTATTTATTTATATATRPLLDMETFEMKSDRIRQASPYSHLPNWKLMGLIAKSNDDVRQEVFVMQLIMYYQMAFKTDKISVWLHTYRILSTTKTTGLIQLIPNAVSLDGLKKDSKYPGSLRSYFELTYGKPYGGVTADYEPPAFQTAINEYVKSLAGYSIVSYLLGIKDRHNGNVMIDTSGHLIHIDFGFVFGLAPGKQFSMEKAPFKLTAEMVEVMGGVKSSYFTEYIKLCTKAFMAARKHAYSVVRLMEVMSFQSNYPAFRYNKNAITDFHKRLMLDVADNLIENEVRKLIDRSYNHRGTILYDQFQLATNGIAV